MKISRIWNFNFQMEGELTIIKSMIQWKSIRGRGTVEIHTWMCRMIPMMQVMY